MNIYDFLDQHEIPYERHDHPPVYTVAEAEDLNLEIGGEHTKNLFLRNKKGKRHLLLVAHAETVINLKELGKRLGISGLSLASPERLMTHLGIEPGAVSPLALLNDRVHAVEVIIEQAVWEAESIRCHPLVNTATLVISMAGLAQFFAATGHDVEVVGL